MASTRYGRVPVAPPEEELAAMLAMDNYFEFPSDSESDDDDFIPPTSALTRQDREDAEEENKFGDDTDYDIDALLKPITEYDDYMAMFGPSFAQSASYESNVLNHTEPSQVPFLPQQSVVPQLSTTTAWPTPNESAHTSVGHLSQSHSQPLMPLFPHITASTSSSQHVPTFNTFEVGSQGIGEQQNLYQSAITTRPADENARPEVLSLKRKRHKSSPPPVMPPLPPPVQAVPTSASDTPSLDFSRSNSVEDTEFYARNTKPPDAFRPRALDIPGSPRTKAKLKKERSAIQSRQFRARKKRAQEDHSALVQHLEQENYALKMQVAELQFRLQQPRGHLPPPSHLTSGPLQQHVSGNTAI